MQSASQNGHELCSIVDIIAAINLARSRLNPLVPSQALQEEITSLERRLQNFSLEELLEASQRAREQESFDNVRDLREAAISIHLSCFESMTDTDLSTTMAAARSAGDNLRILAVQRVVDGRERERTRASLQRGDSESTDDCPLCQVSLTAGRCIPWPGACPREHSVHAQCLVDFRDRTRNDLAFFMCPQCRCPLDQGGNEIIDMLNLQPTRGVDSEPVPANSQLVRQAELRSEPGTRNSSLPRAVAFCCPHLISMHSGMRGRVPLAWAPDLTHAGDVLVPMWMCEVCNVPLLWTDFVSAATFPVSSDFLELVGSCPEHRASARYQVSRSSGTSNLETTIQYQCGCRVSLDTISS